jgi:hypothetical protein
MTAGLKILQTAARSNARRARLLESRDFKSYAYNNFHADDSGISIDDVETENAAGKGREKSRENGSVTQTEQHHKRRQYLHPQLPSIDMGVSTIINRFNGLCDVEKESEDRTDEAIYLQDPSDFRQTRQSHADTSEHGRSKSHEPELQALPSINEPQNGGASQPRLKTADGLQFQQSLPSFAVSISKQPNESNIGIGDNPDAILQCRAASMTVDTPKSIYLNSINQEGDLSAHQVALEVIGASHKPAVNQGSSMSPNASGKALTSPQELSEDSQDDGDSLVGSFDNDSCDDQSEFNDKGLPNEAMRHHSMLLSLTAALRYRLLCQLMKIFYMKFNEVPVGPFVECPGNVSARNTSTGTTTTSPSATVSSGSGITGNANKKHAADDDKADDEQADKRNSKRSRQDPPKSPTILVNRRKFACPYHKHNPQCFGLNTGVDVCGRGWPDIAKLK